MWPCLHNHLAFSTKWINPFGHVPYQWMLKLHGGWQVCPQRASHENEVAAEADEGGCKTEQKGDPGGGHPGSGLAPDAIGSKTLQWSFDLLGLQLPIWKNAIRQYGVIDQKVRETVSTHRAPHDRQARELPITSDIDSACASKPTGGYVSKVSENLCSHKKPICECLWRLYV